MDHIFDFGQDPNAAAVEAKWKKFSSSFARKRHVQFFERMLDGLPGSFAHQETNLLTLTYFCVSGLDLIDASDALNHRRSRLIEFVYSLQSTDRVGGFYGNPNDARSSSGDHPGVLSTSLTSSDTERSADGRVVVGTSIAMTFAALATLVILGDDLSRVNKEGIIAQLRALQENDGRFCGVVALSLSSDQTPSSKSASESEADMRFVYCAAVVSFIVQDWSGVNVHLMQKFIWRCRTYEGGFAQVPGAECHGGSTYCAVAALYLVSLSHKLKLVQFDCEHCHQNICALFDRNDDPESSSYVRDDLVRWCLLRQRNGFNGRPNKPEDSCYTFWVGAVLKLVNAYEFVDQDLLESFCLETQDCIIGGFAKWPNTRSDPLHAYLTVAGLSFIHAERFDQLRAPFGSSDLNDDGEKTDESTPINPARSWIFKPVHPALNISIPSFLHLSAIHGKPGS